MHPSLERKPPDSSVRPISPGRCRLPNVVVRGIGDTSEVGLLQFVAPEVISVDTEPLDKVFRPPSSNFDRWIALPAIKLNNSFQCRNEIGIRRRDYADIELIHHVAADEIHRKMNVDALLFSLLVGPIWRIAQRPGDKNQILLSFPSARLPHVGAIGTRVLRTWASGVNAYFGELSVSDTLSAQQNLSKPTWVDLPLYNRIRGAEEGPASVLADILIVDEDLYPSHVVPSQWCELTVSSIRTLVRNKKTPPIHAHAWTTGRIV